MFAEAARLQSRGLEQFLASQKKANLHIREIVGLDLKALAKEKQAELGEEEMERTEPMLRNYVHALADFVETVGGRETQSQNGELNVAASVATIKKAEVKPRVWRRGRELSPLTIITFSDERSTEDFDTVFGPSRTVKFQKVDYRIRLRKTRPQAHRNDFEWAFESGVHSHNADTCARAQGILSRDDPITNVLHALQMYYAAAAVSLEALVSPDEGGLSAPRTDGGKNRKRMMSGRETRSPGQGGKRMGRKILEEEDTVRMRGRMLHRTFQAAGEEFLGFRETPVGLPPQGWGGVWPMVPPHGSAYGGAQGLRSGGVMGEHRGRDWRQWGVLARGCIGATLSK
uniref:Uncharacterized protein n=1 Tax=Chromera velia CCMP2878 TaxID=1169474 RepID=A0A0G4FMH6_9ALVE|eukprot:Cvel_17731.t1-p1 / transcript=Cvel_17731.t1 / gene=Cvel_17731 / organism=Chromera_velia_CCMP2878 / gene_product=hypothetical protein / transcript_product=hypothetical protein / location=Cvel_scaffold1432:35053-36489(+) / protein_length=342 / sequence_SO=supercontig / SO=protein_coding / is_pseudo=false